MGAGDSVGGGYRGIVPRPFQMGIRVGLYEASHSSVGLGATEVVCVLGRGGVGGGRRFREVFSGVRQCHVTCGQVGGNGGGKGGRGGRAGANALRR